ncbi:hypothetical protein [Fontivita pretiosa]|uniref:hypothetical protein n=1 Tax=Fontivita pretiosa TaxID=2989684 RepID=UPI003D176D1E
MVASRRTVRFRLSVCLLALAVLLANQVPALAGEICRALADATARPCCQPQGPQHDPAPADDDAGDPDCRTCVLCQANGGMLSIIMPQTLLSSLPRLSRINIDPATALDQSAKDPLVPPPRV